MSTHARTLRALVLAAGLLWLAAPAAWAQDADVARLQAQLAQMQADPALARAGLLERMEAQRAIAALAEARRRDRDEALYLAGRRVEIARIAAANELARDELVRLDLQRSELLLEASRREAERARQESERLRIQAQIQAEEAERLRLAAEAEALARTEVEQALGKATGRQVAQLSAARRKEADLARQEAELVSGAKLPASRFEGQREVFTLPGSAFAPGKSSLSQDGASAARALAAYLQIGNRQAQVSAWGNNAGLAQARADALRDALVAEGVPAARIKAGRKAGAASNARSAEVSVVH